METRPKFKNSFGVSGTKGELLHFREIVEKIGWGFEGNYAGGRFLIFKAWQGKAPENLKVDHYWESVDCYSRENIHSLSTPSGWQRALSLAEEKEEEVPEYVEYIDEKEMIFYMTTSKIYKALAVEYSNEYYLIENNKGEKCQYNKKHFKPSTKEAYARQELLEQAKMVDNIIHEQFGTAIKDCIKSMEQLSEAIQETLNKIKK